LSEPKAEALALLFIIETIARKLEALIDITTTQPGIPSKLESQGLIVNVRLRGRRLISF
jgi:hypothetical protein